MKIDLNIDPAELAEAVAKVVIEQIKNEVSKKEDGVDDLFTVKSLAEYLQVSTQWVYERVQKNEVPFIKLGKFPRFRRADIDAWLESQKVPTVNPLSRPLKVFPKKNCG